MAMTTSSGTIPEPSVSRFGLSQVYTPPGGSALVDVVFVHGLNGDPHKTWTSEKSKIFWPAQLLPPILEDERARVLVYGYDADVTSFTDGVSRDKIHNHAEHLIAELAANRRIRKATERPIIFVAHSLGGLVVKRALIYSSEIRGNYTEHLRSVFVSTYGILFLGTPHKGSDVAKWGSRLEWICQAVVPKGFVDTEPQLVDALKTNNETLQNIDRQFIQLMSRFHIYFFHEGKPTNLKGTYRFIVDEESASPTVQDVERASIQADHSHMCKFENDSAPGFDLVAEGIQRYAGEAPGTISVRWLSEKAERNAKKRAEVEEIMPGIGKGTPKSDSESTNTSTPDTSSTHLPLKDEATNTPTKPTQPYFIVPPGFRKNTFFVGMDKEYRELDKRLFDKRRHIGTACVLLHGQPGGGKSHLAREYVYNNKKKFAGGIYWITATSKEERIHAFWNIKQRVIARDSPEICEGVNPNDFVQLVKNWFEERQEWLIVFENVVVDKDEEVVDFVNFVPDNENSSIIYISRAKNLESKQRLLRPFPIKVGPLNEDEAKKLLFKELHIKKPTEGEKRKATELVKQIGGLPLAIDAISHRLGDTHEPLIKYKLSYSTDPIIETTYNQILDDLLRLERTEAWNLINIICWFAQDLPVEMVHLGLRILRAENVEVRATEFGGKPDINTTFGELMRHALIERNEPDEKESISGSHDSLVDPEPIDMLKIHSVVQNFCCDSLNARNLLPQWLGYAVNLFSFSYKQADVKIKQKSEPGRVSDYRFYKVHGQRLWDHTIYYETKLQPLQQIRAILESTMKMIEQEILLREPGSSQESLRNGIFQISIFDRTSSSGSESAPSISGPITPDHRPIPPPLDNETLFGFPIDKATDSPGSVGTVSPGIRPKIVNNSPRLPDYGDMGYDSDREDAHTSQPMQPNLSETTERPAPRSPAPTAESHSEGWQVVSSSKKPRKPRRSRRDLGSFRPTPSKAQIERTNVAGSVTQSTPDAKDQRRGSSPAFKSLEKVQSRSPPRSRNGISSFFQRRPQSRPSTASSQPTWAGIAAGTTAAPLPQQSAPYPSQTGPSHPPFTTERGRSRESLKGRQGSAQPSPLASEFVPLRGSSNLAGLENFRTSPPLPTQPNELPPAGFQYATPYPGSASSLVQPFYTPPPALGPSPAPLPYDESVTITTKRTVPPEFRSNLSSPQSHPASQSPPSRTSPYQQIYDTPYPPPIMPTGYYSQPMSRNHSHLSRGSTPETEPIRYPSPFSPQLLPASSPPHERHPDGRPLRKSPKTDFALLPTSTSARVSPPTIWARPPSPSHSSPGPGLYDTMSMSRSSSGPGVAVETSPGHGLGIVRFDNVNTASVQFGDHAPVSVEDARRRTWAYEQSLRERERRREMEALREVDERRGEEGEGLRQRVGHGDAGRESVPYPERNRIPEGGGEVVGTGTNAPVVDDGVGLGVNMG